MSIHRRHVMQTRIVAAVLAPFVVVQAGRWMGTFELAASNASGGYAEEAVGPALAAAPVTTEQELALEWSRAHRLPGTRSSPLGQLSAPPPPPMPEVIQTPEAPDPNVIGEEMVKALTLHSVMGQGETGVAVIQGRLSRRGDEVLPGWRLRFISARDRCVELENTEGVVVRLELGAP